LLLFTFFFHFAAFFKTFQMSFFSRFFFFVSFFNAFV